MVIVRQIVINDHFRAKTVIFMSTAHNKPNPAVIIGEKHYDHVTAVHFEGKVR